MDNKRDKMTNCIPSRARPRKIGWYEVYLFQQDNCKCETRNSFCEISSTYQSLQRAFKKCVLSDLVFAFVNVWHSFVSYFFKNQFFRSELTRPFRFICGGFYFKLVIRFTLK
jgi:hypothetical protein